MLLQVTFLTLQYVCAFSTICSKTNLSRLVIKGNVFSYLIYLGYHPHLNVGYLVSS